jgi:hypothetical protein
MAAIGQIDPAGTASIRGLGPGNSVAGLQNEEQDEFNRGADIDRAEQRAAAVQPAVGEDQAGGVVQTATAANVNQVTAAGAEDDGGDQQSEIRNELASQDQQLPTPFDPNRGTQLDIAV